MATERHEKCVQRIAALLKDSPTLVFVIKAAQRAHRATGGLGTAFRAVCTPCPPGAGVAGHFDVRSRTAHVCEDAPLSRTDMRHTLVHDALRAYDAARIDLDPACLSAADSPLGIAHTLHPEAQGGAGDPSASTHTRPPRHGNERACAQLACTEIRAANLSGECAFGREWMRGHVSLTGNRLGGAGPVAGHMPRCVRRRALEALRGAAPCVGVDLGALLDRTFPPCVADVAPFIAVPYTNE